MSDIKIDILLATYNGSKYIVELIESILSQSYANYKLIICDDASTDGTYDLLTRYAIQDDRIELHKNNVNLGVVRNFEKLMKLSDAKYFMLCDQDDVWHKDKVLKSLEQIVATNSLLVYTDLKIITSREESISYWKREGIKPLSGSPFKTLLVQNVITGCTIIADKRIINFAIPIPSKFCLHDQWLGIVASVYGSISYLEETLIDYRQHEGNVIGSKGYYKVINTEAGKQTSYSEYLLDRKTFIDNQYNFYKYCIDRFSENPPKNKSIIKQLQQLLELFETFRTKSNIFVRLKNGLKLKRLFPSQGATRNVYWVCYFVFPIFVFVPIKISKFIIYSLKKLNIYI
ncbi:hypothetical protein J31TS4_32400 [Paenibacillus sp. J31TS4]|uniref:glycosyltransferase family 2 protein n=1 Tax=Paenibacillus sp. J31TS4 TaxID=2807195 RepID=UPI001B0C8CF2|nr:glycosyltransferase family 2 protein [Paenibacillus sp. J31TS4]GIP39960.1 hypothetical protein J31TS4_32400 [Paenibacillus sp. J31TS4]